MLPAHAFFSTERCFLNLFGQFDGDMWQARVIGDRWIRCVAAEDDFIDAKSVGRTKQGADIMAAAQVMGDEDDVAHATTVPCCKSH